MHGLGDTAMGFLDVFDSASSPVPTDSTKVILLTSKWWPVTINGGMMMPSWYDYLSFSFSGSDKIIDEI